MRNLLAVLSCAAALAGCQSSLTGVPPPSLEPDRDVLKYAIDAALTPAALDTGLRLDASAEVRNSVIFARMAEVDRLYYEFERDLSRESRDTDLVVALAALAAGIGGTLASNGASQAFSAASTAIAGVDEAFDKNVLVERTVASLVSQMRANRAQVKTQIYVGLTQPVGTYPLIVALSDLEAYYQAGTLAAGLMGIAEVTTRLEREASEELAETVNDFRVSEVVVVQTEPRAAETITPQRVATTQEIRDAIRAASDDAVLRLVNDPPVTSPAIVAAIASFGPEALTRPLFARSALVAALQATDRTDANLALWASALSD